MPSRTFVTLSLMITTSLAARAQHIYSIRADSVRIYNVCDTAELILENKTQGVTGYLYNRGAGRTEFRKLKLTTVGDSRLAIAGQDTIDLATLKHIGGIDSVYRSGDSLRFVRRGIATSFYAPVSPETLQSVTDGGNVSARDGNNLILKRKTTGAGNLTIRFRNSDDSDRGYIGYGGEGHNSFIIHTNDGSMTAVSGKLQVNSPSDNDQTNGLSVGGHTRTTGGVFKQTPNHPNPQNNSGNQFWNALGGAQLRADAEFRYSANGIGKYDNRYSSGFTFMRDSASLGERIPNSSGWYLKMSYDSTGVLPDPGLGGFRADVPSKRNAVYVSRIRAKLPVGYTLQVGTDPFGTNNNHYFVTDNKGTGKWEDYIHVHHTGYQGTFQPLGFYYLNGPRSKVTWYVAYFDMKETTAASWTDYVRQDSLSARPRELFLGNDNTRIEQGENNTLRIMTPNGQIQIGAQSNAYLHLTTDRENFYFSKPVLAVGKLAIYNSGQSAASTTYLAQTEGRINNSPILTEGNAATSVIQNQVNNTQTGNFHISGRGLTRGMFEVWKNGADTVSDGVILRNATRANGANFQLTGDAVPGLATWMSTGSAWVKRMEVAANGSVSFDYMTVHGFSGERMSQRYNAIGFNRNVHNGTVFDASRAAYQFSHIYNASPAEDFLALQVYNSTGAEVNNVALTANSLGNIGINERKATERLQVSNGEIYIKSLATTDNTIHKGIKFGTDNDTYFSAIRAWRGTPSTRTGLSFFVANAAAPAEAMRLDETGKLTVYGTITATTITQTSRRALKTDIHAYQQSALNVLGQAQVRTFRFKADTTRQHIGFIADEVPEEMAVPDRSGVDQGNTVALLVKAVQELEARNKQLEDANGALRQQNTSLEKRLQAIEELIRKTK